MVEGNAGKGDRIRPFDRKKWDKAWEHKEKKEEENKKERKNE